MSQLSKLKKWLTLEEAAKYLTAELHEPIQDFDLIKLAFDHHLKLSVLINSMTAEKGSLSALLTEPEDFYYDEALIWKTDETIETLSGCFDLPLFGYERLFAQNKYHQLTQKNDIAHENRFPNIFVSVEKRSSCDEERRGIFIADIEGQLYRLISTKVPLYDVVTEELICVQERVVTDQLPFNTPLVARIETLNKFVTTYKALGLKSIEEKEINTKTKNKLLKIIQAFSNVILKDGLTGKHDADAAEIERAYAKLNKALKENKQIEFPVNLKSLGDYLEEAG